MSLSDVELNPGSGGAKIAVDVIGDDAFEVVKQAFGVEGVATMVNAGDPLPVTDSAAEASLESIDGKLSNPLPLPSGAATAANQQTDALTDAQLRATPVPVSGTVTANTGLSQPLTDTQLRATPVPVSGTVTVDTSTLATSANQTNANQKTQVVDGSGNVIGATSNALDINIKSGNPTTIAVTQGTSTNLKAQAETYQGGTAVGAANPLQVTGANGTFPVSGTVTITPSGTQDENLKQVNGATVNVGAGAASTGTQRVITATDSTIATVTAVTAITNALPAGSNAIGKLAANAGVNIGDVAVTSITPPTLTKGTQGSTGFSVQDLKDAGRVAKRYSATAAAAGTTTTETAITLTTSSQDAANSTGTSFTPTSGKTFRMQAIVFATRGNITATTQTTIFNLRLNTSGAVTTSTTPILLSVRCTTPATTLAWDRLYIEIPDGMEIYGDGTKQWGVTAAATYTTNAPTWDVLIIGYEY